MNPQTITEGSHSYTHRVRTTLTTTDATPTDVLTVALALNSTVTIWVEAQAKDSTGATVAEWRARNTFQRTSGGTSTRAGSANGTQDSVANQFAPTRPSVTFGDPAVSNDATVVATGKAATTITWYFAFRYSVGT